jgi:hypothetical protein
MVISIVVTLQVEGFHYWINAPIKFEYLKSIHRHIFHIKATKKVSHNDRDIEIISFKREIYRYLLDMYGNPCFFGNMSCEDIACRLCEHFDLDSCEVCEDGENGSIVSK